MTRKEEKNRRMNIRRRLGNRTLPGFQPPVRAKGPAYRLTYVCFNCRTSFKYIPIENFRYCDDCDEQLAEMGRSFRVPSKSQNRQWKKIEMLFNAGERFWSYGRSEKIPNTIRETKNYVKKYRKNSISRFRNSQKN